MNWNFNTLTSQRPTLERHNVRLESLTLKWAKQVARERHAPFTQTIRELLAQAVAYWRQEGHTSGQPWGDDSKVGLRGSDVTTLLLDADTFTGLQEIMQASGKTLSRVISEILLDAMVAETAQMQRGMDRRKSA
jgi:hypothetical protein